MKRKNVAKQNIRLFDKIANTFVNDELSNEDKLFLGTYLNKLFEVKTYPSMQMSSKRQKRR